MPEYSYSPTTWTTGDTITATKLNNLESGIQNATSTNRLYLCTDTNGTLNRSYDDIKTALLANKNIYVTIVDNNVTYYFLLTSLEIIDGIYRAIFVDAEYSANSSSTNLIFYVPK